MNLREIIRFLQPTTWCVVCFGLFVAASGAIDAGRGAKEPAALHPHGPAALRLPSPELGPAQVVQIQLEGMANRENPEQGMLQCFWHASPANRLVTGPFERFEAMVRRDPYLPLTQPSLTAIGRTEILESEARVLVTVVDAKDRVHAFIFVLARQNDVPFKNCWMTEGVFRVGSIGSKEKIQEADA